MQNTSELYKELLALPHTCEVSVAIGDTGKLVDDYGDYITFGGTAILVAAYGGDSGYGQNLLISCQTSRAIFADSSPSVGCCVSGTIKVQMLKPAGDIPRMARLVPYVRLTDGVRHSEWIQKGVYFLDTREISKETELEIITLTGYDAMLKGEQYYPPSTLSWPAPDVDVVQEIAEAMGVQVDKRTWDVMTRSYLIEYPAEYTCREVLGYIAASYGGNFVMSDIGELLLIGFAAIPKETNLLIDHAGDQITFGGDRIIV